MKKIALFIALVLSGAGMLVSCSNNDSASLAPTQGQGGSMARFAISGNHLYTVDETRLHLFDISNPAVPEKKNEVPLTFGVETIFPYADKLFIGTQTGMYIMSLQNPAAPGIVSHYQHVFSCDPVVTDGRYAYVTLSSGNTCSRGVNRLEIIDLQNISAPVLLKEYPMVNPLGLGIDNDNLFVCDNGLKLYDATNVEDLRLKQHFNMKAYDVIPDNGNLLVIGSDGFYQYRYTADSLQFLSKIVVQRPI